jgi:UDP-N-acetylmuramoyl-tripeptide--D-alanyl-D-alanine ligase
MNTTEKLYEHFLQNRTISTDTRNITDGCIFFALKGDTFNANAFALDALEKGASFAVIDEEKYAITESCILVDDVLSTLQDLARHHRKQLNIPVIGLTGSNGKTTSKELIKAVLAEQFKTFATFGNLNNHIGVPLSILSITPDIEIAVIEMGANHQKEIELLCTIAQPTHGIITNVGMAHLEGFGGFEGVKKGKAELYAYLKNNNGYTFVNRDNVNLMEMADTFRLNKIIYYGTGIGNTIKGKLLTSDPFIEVNWTNQEVETSLQTNLTGSYNFENILAAICIGDFFDMPAEKINNGLSNYQPKNNRSQLTKTERNTVICDFYNANPSSMMVAITNLSTLTSTNKIAILGDMFELGPEAAQQHYIIAKQAAESNFDKLILIGTNFFEFKDEFDAIFFKQPADAADFLQQNPIENNLVLLKGSRGMKLENLMQYL